jgi:hypothetical protein
MKWNQESPKASPTVIILSFILVAAMIATALLPHMYPDSSWINFLFGKNRFILFWLILAFVGILLMGVGKPKGPK